MFTEIDDQPRNRSQGWWRVGVVVVAILTSASLVILAKFTDIFTRGRIDDLPLAERKVLDEIQSTGIRVLASPLTCFGAPSHVVVKVHWNHEASRYAVSAVEIRCESIDELLPFIRRLSHVNDVRAPLQNIQSIDMLLRILPGTKVSRVVGRWRDMASYPLLTTGADNLQP